ncbi:MAG TPA: PP2C family protein-serine/threonine phosphatase [Terriglobales bacterium]|nr:PP2C family protein-serine/threonine phosphatase [Terriglobales bacterium]
MNAPSYQAVPPPPNPPPHRPEILVALDRFWQRVTEGLQLNQLWSQFKSDARSSYRLYSRDFEKSAPERSWRHNFFHTLQEFAWAILEKLSPPRRVLLLFAVVLLIIPGGGFSYQGKHEEIRVGAFDFHFYGGVLLFLLLMLEVADRVVMKRDLQIARDIQAWLLPAAPPEVPGVAIAFATRAANTVAGDYYDIFARPAATPGEMRYLIAVADVAGKSIPAALLMATFQASLKTLSSTSTPLEELVLGMNRYACTNSQGGLRFTTAFLAEYVPDSRALKYINAGHNAPVLRRHSGSVERLHQGGMPLGIQADAGFESARVVLDPGDWLVVFTDGLVEAVNARDEEYGEQRMLNLLHASASVTPEQVLRRMMIDVDAFVGTTPQHDDITCLLVKVG